MDNISSVTPTSPISRNMNSFTQSKEDQKKKQDNTISDPEIEHTSINSSYKFMSLDSL